MNVATYRWLAFEHRLYAIRGPLLPDEEGATQMNVRIYEKRLQAQDAPNYVTDS